MDLTPYVAAMRDDLAAAASVGDEATARAGTSLAAALEPSLRLALMNALSDFTTEVSDALGDRTVGLRLQGREVHVVVDRDGTDEAGDQPAGFFAGPASSPFPGGGVGGPGRQETPDGPGPFPRHGGPDVGDISRMTLRLVDQIKGQAERAAAAQGMSLNSWVAQAVQGALRGQGRWPGHGWREHGWGEHGWGEHGWGEHGPGEHGPGGDDRSDDHPGPRDGPDDGPDDPGGVSGWVRG